MPLYHITEDGQPERLVDAKSSAAAIRFVIEPRVKAEVIASPLKAAEIMEAGVKLERVTAEVGDDATEAA